MLIPPLLPKVVLPCSHNYHLGMYYPVYTPHEKNKVQDSPKLIVLLSTMLILVSYPSYRPRLSGTRVHVALVLTTHATGSSLCMITNTTTPPVLLVQRYVLLPSSIVFVVFCSLLSLALCLTNSTLTRAGVSVLPMRL